METSTLPLLDNGSVLTIIGSLVAIFLAIIGYFLNREFKQTDTIKDTLVSIDKKMLVSDDILKHITSNIESINEKFDSINEKFDSVNNKLQTIDKDSSTTKHELEMISNMIKPLFEIKETVDKTSQSIAELFKRSENQKDALYAIYERLNKLEKYQK